MDSHQKKKKHVVNCSTADSATPKGVKWCVDAGASRHLSPNEVGFENRRELPEPRKVRLAGGRELEGSIAGDVTICPGLVLKEVVCIPGLEEPVISVGALLETSNITVYMTDVECTFRDLSTGQVIAAGYRDANRLYAIDTA